MCSFFRLLFVEIRRIVAGWIEQTQVSGNRSDVVKKAGVHGTMEEDGYSVKIFPYDSTDRISTVYNEQQMVTFVMSAI